MSLAFLYAGQGSQTPGMGRDLYDAYPGIRPLFDTPVSSGECACGCDGGTLDLKALCFDAPAETLSKTHVTQPCMGAFAAAVTQLLFDAGVRPAYAAGLSLGEYGALHAAGVFDAPTLLSLLAFRGRVMEEATAGLEARMTAVLGLSAVEVEQAVDSVRRDADALRVPAPAGRGGDRAAVVSCANFNCPGQVVIGGDAAAVALAEDACLKAGARRLLPLNVSGPFHTPLMAPAGAKLRDRLASVPMRAPAFPVLFNASGDLLKTGDSIPLLLEWQIQCPVRFEQSLRRLGELGVDTVVEIGPGRVLSGFVKKTVPSLTCHTVEDVPSLRAALAALAE